MIQIGDRLPALVLTEWVAPSGEACAAGPQPVDLLQATAGKTVAIFAVPGAFTPTCSNQHLPGYLAAADELHAAGVDEIWCISVNDPFVMGAWGQSQGVGERIRMLADGSAALTQALGLTLDLTAKGFGLRSNRYSMLVRDGVVRVLNNEGPGRFEVSDANTLLQQIPSI